MGVIFWVYIQTRPDLWTVGFYDPQGKWHPESDHDTPMKAARWVHYLNGNSTIRARISAEASKAPAVRVS